MTSSSGPYDADAFGSCWRFATPGTNEGDWYLPSWYDLSKFNSESGYNTIQGVFNSTRTLIGTTYGYGYMQTNYNNNIFTATVMEDNDTDFWLMNSGDYGEWAEARDYKSSSFVVFPVFIPTIKTI